MAIPVELERVRAELDRLDANILEYLARRHDAVRVALSIKQKLGLPMVDPAREEQLLRAWRAQADGFGLPRAVAEAVLAAVLKDSHEMAAAPPQPGK